MKTIWQYFIKFQNDHFHAVLYLCIALFLGVCIYLNFSMGLERQFIQVHSGSWVKWPLMSLEMGFPFLFICFLLYLSGANKKWISSKEFWILFFFGFTVIGFQRGFFLHRDLVSDLPYADRYFLRKLLWWARPLLTTFISISLFYWFYERKRDGENHWYGLSVTGTNFKPYFLLLAFVIVGLAIGSFFNDLAEYYPRYQKSGGAAFAEKYGLGEWLTVLLYELVYGSSFLSVELFFRGFLILGFARILGGYAVLAMIGSYVFLHFSKPLTECISSAFGGYLLGILTFYSRRIWGGIFLHVALAWGMEFFAWLQKLNEP